MTRKLGFIRQGLRIKTHTRIRSVEFVLLVLLCGTSALYCIYPYFQADLLVAKEQTIESYTSAIAHDEENAELWWVRGRLQHYSLERNNLPAAIQDYKHALSLNPRLGQAWMDLADCLEQEGNDTGAEESLRNALKVWTYSPIVHWQAGNYYLTRKNMEKMYRHLRTAIEYDAEKLDIALNIVWRMEPNPSKILSNLVPDKTTANLSALTFFIARDELSLAGKAWSRLIRNSLSKTPPMDSSVAFSYIDALLSKNQIEDAYRVWMESQEKFTLHQGTRPGLQSRMGFRPNPQGNLVWNGSFEDNLQDGGFDWRRQKTDDVDIQTDSSVSAEGRKSLRISFNDINIDFAHLSQILPTLSAGNYRLQYHLKTEHLTTDQRPYFIIESFPGSQSIMLHTDFFPAASEWGKYSFSFKVNPGIKAVKLSLRRSPSGKFDSLIKGSLWLDDMMITVEDQTFAQEKKNVHGTLAN